ncbi:sulfurtransferase TusA family protein [Kitasatospora sp. A2-31]|uniref:sulfurtransferase TusA family protein n=1 Tax=Kitasatospora sp. A2-31 TaxID=2916414 RepID=UPI001EEC9737|nr:sulfurtransferase TusA family protein [Kitasatospora sp. A2-31]MCG6494260.1 sulfurtransferase TusA family protein [Kitasatospora sp. A2-31]
MTRTTGGVSTPLLVDGSGMLCVTLLLHLRRLIAGAPGGTIVHVVTTDPAAPLDLPAWCHLTGHAYLGPVRDETGRGRDVHALRLADDPVPTHPAAPWRTTTVQQAPPAGR